MVAITQTDYHPFVVAVLARMEFHYGTFGKRLFGKQTVPGDSGVIKRPAACNKPGVKSATKLLELESRHGDELRQMIQDALPVRVGAPKCKAFLETQHQERVSMWLMQDWMAKHVTRSEVPVAAAYVNTSLQELERRFGNELRQKVEDGLGWMRLQTFLKETHQIHASQSTVKGWLRLYSLGDGGAEVTLQELHDEWGAYIQQELESSTAGAAALVARMKQTHNVTVSEQTMRTYIDRVRNNQLEVFSPISLEELRTTYAQDLQAIAFEHLGISQRDLVTRLATKTGRPCLPQLLDKFLKEADFYLSAKQLAEYDDHIIKLLDDAGMTPFGILNFLARTFSKTTSLDILDQHLKVLLNGIGERPIDVANFVSTMLTYDDAMFANQIKKWLVLLGGTMVENFEALVDKTRFKDCQRVTDLALSYLVRAIACVYKQKKKNTVF